ncbi:hypothetical protein [Herbaspirillum sp. NPDC087042]|uniref:hypothetical protein n=1 Tax=Herbaspirillum sp. NPDC087042 TaxID=3364004 RepID=UPI00380C3A12
MSARPLSGTTGASGTSGASGKGLAGRLFRLARSLVEQGVDNFSSSLKKAVLKISSIAFSNFFDFTQQYRDFLSVFLRFSLSPYYGSFFDAVTARRTQGADID